MDATWTAHAWLTRLRLAAAVAALPLALVAALSPAPSRPVVRSLAALGVLLCLVTVVSEPRQRRVVREAHEAGRALAEHLARDAERADRVRARRARIERVLEGRDAPQIVFQPFVVLSSGEVSGYEALSRFSVGSPHEWFAEAAALGLREELELKAIHRALRSLDALPGRDPYLAVKASGGTVLSERFHALMARTDPRRVVLELTEHDGATDYAELLRRLAPLRARGARLAVDGVGLGRASLLQVAMLEPDIIKIDSSFTRGLATGSAARSTVTALVGLGESLHATVVAAAVETAGALTAARDLGVHAAQGWHLGQPRPLDQLLVPAPRAGSVHAAQGGEPG